jgi:hypothetical protein
MNPLTSYFVPEWVSIAFLIAIPLPFVLLLSFVFGEAKKLANVSLFRKVVGFYVFYLLYIGFASYNDWFDVVSFPPRVLLLTTFPYALLLFGFVLNAKPYKQIFEEASLSSLVRLHIFRVVGVFFIILASYDALPKPFAYIAGIGDVTTALSSIWVARAIVNQKSYAKQLTFFWNLFGAIDILFTAVAANVLTKLSIETGSMGVDTLARFPFCIIPAFAPPTILFLHWVIFTKLKKN